MYKVFIYDKPVYLTSDPDFEIKNCQQLRGVDVEKILVELSKELVEGIVVLSKDLSLDWNKFTSFFKPIVAAGGVVENEQGALLVIYRLGKWDLPKGKLEKGEEVRLCAVREVEEECGIEGLEITGDLPVSYHCYPYKKGWAMKTTFWFRMKTSDDRDLKPQVEEGITEVMWCAQDNLQKVYLNTYQSITDVLVNAGY